MGYVVKDLDEEKDRNGQGGRSTSGVTGSAPRQGVNLAAAPQQSAQQKTGTGFTNLSSWLDAGKGRDKSITDTGAKKLGNEKTKFDTALGAAESGLASQNPINLQVGTEGALDIEAGNDPGGVVTSGPLPSVQPTATATAATPEPTIASNPALGVLAPGSVRRIGGTTSPAPATGGQTVTSPSAPAPLTLTQAPDISGGDDPSTHVGPTIDEVLNQADYSGPTAIDYQAGDDFTDALMLGNTSTVADVLGKDSINAGQYTGGMRSLDNILYGADRASQDAIAANVTNTDAFKKDVTDKAGDFSKRAQEKANAIADAKRKIREELTTIGDTTRGSIEARAKVANEAAQARLMAAVPEGMRSTGWDGDAAGSANSGNIQTDNEARRFSALKKYLGYDAPERTGQYKDGKKKLENIDQDKEIFAGLSEGNKPEDFNNYIEKLYNGTEFNIDGKKKDIVSQMYEFLNNDMNGDAVGKSLKERFTPEQYQALWRNFVKTHGGG